MQIANVFWLDATASMLEPMNEDLESVPSNIGSAAIFFS
jgi:hypothetical protein